MMPHTQGSLNFSDETPSTMKLPTGWPAGSDWTGRLSQHFQTDSFQSLLSFVATERKSSEVFPPASDVFNAFALTSFEETKVVILGQDPYHGPGQAHGLSFSVQGDIKLPPSLKNIYKELVADLGGEPPNHGNLTGWAQQGVFLLNTVLTVRNGEANSHRNKGWEEFTDEVIRQLDSHPQGVVFILWGKPAEKKTELINSSRHKVIISPHPSPLSARRGFFESRPFSRANEALREIGRETIDWCQI